MKVDFKRSFLGDLKRIKDPVIKGRVRETIHSIEQAQVPGEVKGLKKLRYGDRYYRIRIGE